MLAIQKKYLDTLRNVRKEVSSIDLSHDYIKDIDELNTRILEGELIVPVIGAFSSGKSSLINSFLGEDILSVGITPETSLATELNYALDQRVEAIMSSGEVIRFDIDEFSLDKIETSSCSYLRYYLARDALKSIEPLVLVDMPGFDSPLDAHNKAILTYIGRASHFIVLVSVEDGTLPRSIFSRLIELQTMGHGFDFFLSKTNLRPESAVQAVATEVQERLRDGLDIDQPVLPVGDDGGKALGSILAEIDPEQLFRAGFQHDVEGLIDDIICSINVKVSAFENEQHENENALEELTTALNRMERKIARLKENARIEAESFNQNRVITTLGREMNRMTEELVELVMTNQTDEVEHRLNDCVRSTLMREINAFFQQASDEWFEQISLELKEVENASVEAALSGQTRTKLGGFMEMHLKNLKTRIDKKAGDTTSTDKNGKIYKILTTITAVTTSVLAPILELVIIFLPEIIDHLVNTFAQNAKKEKIRSTLRTRIYPEIKTNVRQVLPDIITKQTIQLLDSIDESMKEHIEGMQAEIAKAEEEKRAMGGRMKEEIARYRSTADRISALNQAIAA